RQPRRATHALLGPSDSPPVTDPAPRRAAAQRFASAGPPCRKRPPGMGSHAGSSPRLSAHGGGCMLYRCPRECVRLDRKSTRLNSSHVAISYAVFCLKKKKTTIRYVRSTL